MNIPTEKVDKYKDYAIITVCPDDFRALIDSIDGEGDPKFKDVIATVDGLTDEEWKHMAMAMADELYNGDAYNEALMNAANWIESVKAHRTEASA
jgi:hypothetical protein